MTPVRLRNSIRRNGAEQAIQMEIYVKSSQEMISDISRLLLSFQTST